jgi:tetratricopeptide (TPR) repeat protein
VQSALDTAEQLQYADPHAAIVAYQQALQAQPENVQILDALGELLLEVGDGQTAAELLQRSIQLAPGANASKYMYMGQLQEGADAISCFERGIAILQQELQKLDVGDAAHRSKLQGSLCSAHCAIAEVLLLDAADSEDIQVRCQSALVAAREIETASPEPHQGLANLRITQGRADEAMVALQLSLQLTQARVEQARSADMQAAMSGAGGQAESQGDAEIEPPSFGFRMHNGKLLLELGCF